MSIYSGARSEICEGCIKVKNKELIDKIVNYVASSQDNFISDEDAISPDLAGMKIYEKPIVGFARADDELFILFLDKNL